MHATAMEGEGQLAGISAPLLPGGSWGSNSDLQAWQQTPLPAEP